MKTDVENKMKKTALILSVIMIISLSASAQD